MNNNREYEPSGNDITRLAAGTELRDACLISEGDVRIDGKFSGKIETKGKLIVGERAEVHGDVVCMGAEISGRMESNVFAGDCLTLKGNCVFKGVLNITKICIEKGAAFNGNCRMITKEEFDSVAKKDMPEEVKAEAAKEEPDVPGQPKVTTVDEEEEGMFGEQGEERKNSSLL